MAMPASAVALVFLGAVVLLTLLFGYLEIVRVSRAQRWIARGATLVDIDPPETFAKSHPQGAINLPLDDLDELADQLDPKRPVVVYGHHTLSCAIATRELKRRGFRVLDLGPAREDGWLSGEVVSGRDEIQPPSRETER